MTGHNLLLFSGFIQGKCSYLKTLLVRESGSRFYQCPDWAEQDKTDRKNVNIIFRI